MKDFETGIKTEQGEDRCIVAIEMNGEPKKFFTNSEEMKNILSQVKEMLDGFPFETTIKTETFGERSNQIRIYMKRVEGTAGVKLLECVNPVKHVARPLGRAGKEDGSADYMEENF